MFGPGQGIPALCEHCPQGLRSSIFPGALKKGPIIGPQTPGHGLYTLQFPAGQPYASEHGATTLEKQYVLLTENK